MKNIKLPITALSKTDLFWSAKVTFILIVEGKDGKVGRIKENFSITVSEISNYSKFREEIEKIDPKLTKSIPSIQEDIHFYSSDMFNLVEAVMTFNLDKKILVNGKWTEGGKLVPLKVGDFIQLGNLVLLVDKIGPYVV